LTEVVAVALEGIPEVRPGDDIAALIAAAPPPPGGGIGPGDVVVIAHKIVSKAEGRVRALADVTPGPGALSLARAHGKDPRHVQVVLDESQELLRAARGVLICVTRHGFVCANAGVDASNAPGPDTLVLLPLDPDESARELRAALRARTMKEVGVIVSDSFGRPFRHGTTDVAIGIAGVPALTDLRGTLDRGGRVLQSSLVAVADQIAGAADLARGKASGVPVVVVRGLELGAGSGGDRGAAELVIDAERDLFR
jgi:coenzyme F420-0:L-glutamate ligase/coenzyme F420-1:gamma-L-glutamate ligase